MLDEKTMPKGLEADQAITITRKEYDRLIFRHATMETPAKVGWWRRFWGMGTKAAAVSLVLICLLLLTASRAAAREWKREALRGLEGVFVVVEDIRPKAERLGLSKDQIKTDVELRLRKAGVRVLTGEEWWKTPGRPYLYVNVNTAIGDGICAYAIDVELNEKRPGLSLK